MKKLNKKGFTLIELLAVIVILGLLMAIAIPAVTRYITQSRKKTLVDTIDSFISSATTGVNDMEYGALSDEDVTWYIPVSNVESDSCIYLEKGGTDPFGDWKEAYVVVHYDADSYSYDYYFTFIDSGGYGMAAVKTDAIATSGSDITNPAYIATDVKLTTDNIKTQYVDGTTSIKVLTAGTATTACKASSATESTTLTYKIS